MMSLTIACDVKCVDVCFPSKIGSVPAASFGTLVMCIEVAPVKWLCKHPLVKRILQASRCSKRAKRTLPSAHSMTYRQMLEEDEELAKRKRFNTDSKNRDKGMITLGSAKR